jgi:hypothetical protein
MDYDFKNFDKLFLTYIVLVEAKLLNGSKDLKFLIDFQFVTDIFEHLHDFMVVYCVIALFFLLKTALRLFACYYLESAIDFIQFMGYLKVYSEVLRVILHSLVFFNILFFNLYLDGSLRLWWDHNKGLLRSILSCDCVIGFIAHKLIIDVLIGLIMLVLLLIHFIPILLLIRNDKLQSRRDVCYEFRRKY